MWRCGSAVCSACSSLAAVVAPAIWGAAFAVSCRAPRNRIFAPSDYVLITAMSRPGPIMFMTSVRL